MDSTEARKILAEYLLSTMDTTLQKIELPVYDAIAYSNTEYDSANNMVVTQYTFKRLLKIAYNL